MMYLLQHMFVVLLLACSFELFGITHAYPALLPYIYNPTHDTVQARAMMKRNEISFPQIEDDVVELEQLRTNHNAAAHEPMSAVAKRQHETTTSTDENSAAAVVEPDETIVEPVVLSEDDESVINHTNTLPDLERQLELATPLMPGTTTTTTSSASATSKEDIEHTQVEEPKAAVKTPQLPQIVEAPAPPSGKAFYGAARLAFGQNPEVLPTLSTSTSTTTTAAPTSTTSSTAAEASIITTTTTVAPPTLAPSGSVLATTDDGLKNGAPLDELVQTESINTDIIGDANEQQRIAEGEAAASELSKAKLAQLNKETIGDILIDQLATTKTTERRSSMQLSPKTAQSLLRNPNGQYSSFDMAQYVFWTGDEAGVARAVEELIDENLISRENALKFLRDIRLGIEFLQRSYANRIFPEELRQNQIKRNHQNAKTTSTTKPTTTTSTTTEKPLPYMHLDQALDVATQPEDHAEHEYGKNVDSFVFLNKLRELNNEGTQDLADYDDTAARTHLYNEYTLEEILYKLAKVMFAQSLAHGSDEAQQELQKLTDFLEREGNLGVIPIDLQKKVLHTLLNALSDTLSEHPELLPAARLNLANSYYRLPMHTPSH